MYQPQQFKETRLDVLHGLIRAHPLGLLISNGEDGPLANPLPFLLDSDSGEYGALRAHFSKANLQWKMIADSPEMPVLIVFQGPQSYVTPSWYETKRQTGKVVPTWNYAVVQVRGKAEIIDSAEWLGKQIAELTATHESGRDVPWQVTDAPNKFIQAQTKGIIGVSIAIAEIDGKWKVSQNRPIEDRHGVARGLEAESNPAMVALVRKYGALDG